MNKEELIEAIIKKEWPMFHNVNGEDRANCQDNFPTFRIMRYAQYSAWGEKALESYLEDISLVESKGGNIAREKYIRMMASTDPDVFVKFKNELPEDTEEKKAIVSEIWSHMLVQTEKMNNMYPVLSYSGRPLRATEDNFGTSIETYQTCELMTYSEKTLKLFLENLIALENEGVSFVEKIQEVTVKSYGYNSLGEAEREMTWRMQAKMKQQQGCCGCE